MNSTTITSCYSSRLSNVSTPELWSIPNETVPAALTTAVFTSAFIVVGVPCNLLILVSIVWQHLYTEPAHILLINLAVADFLICVLVMPFTVLSGFAGGFILGDNDSTRCRWCRSGVIFVALCLFSLMSLDRFVYIKFPMKYHGLVTGGKTVICVAVFWILCIAVSLFPLFGFGDVVFSLSISTCTLRFEGSTDLTESINYLIFLVVESFIPLSVLIITNTWVACIVLKQIRKLYSNKFTLPNNQQQQLTWKRLSKERNHKQLQFLKVFGAIFLSNVVTWLPLIVHILVTVIKGNYIFPNWMYVSVYLSITSSALFHPLIQASLIPEIRTSCKTVLIKTLCLCSEIVLNTKRQATARLGPTVNTELQPDTSWGTEIPDTSCAEEGSGASCEMKRPDASCVAERPGASCEPVTSYAAKGSGASCEMKRPDSCTAEGSGASCEMKRPDSCTAEGSGASCEIKRPDASCVAERPGASCEPVTSCTAEARCEIKGPDTAEASCEIKTAEASCEMEDLMQAVLQRDLDQAVRWVSDASCAAEASCEMGTCTAEGFGASCEMGT